MKYELRGQTYDVRLAAGNYRATVNGFTVRSAGTFGIGAEAAMGRYFHGTRSVPALVVTRPAEAGIELGLSSWSEDPEGTRRWTLALTGGDAEAGGGLVQQVRLLRPNGNYVVRRDGGVAQPVRTDHEGALTIREKFPLSPAMTFEIAPAEPR